MDFEKLLEKLIKELYENDMLKLDKIDQIDDFIDKVLKEEGYLDYIRSFKSDFNSAVKETLKAFGETSSAGLKALEDASLKNFYRNMQTVIDTEIKQKIRDSILLYNNEGNLATFRQTITGLIDTGKITNNIAARADDFVTIFKRTSTYVLGNEKGVKYYRYVGGTIDSSRCFCERRVNNIYDKKEIENWSKTDWDGKISGTNKVSIFSLCGGWSCRHSLVPISEKRALSEGINKYNSVGCNEKRPKKKKK
jgi:hypothetical protein